MKNLPEMKISFLLSFCAGLSDAISYFSKSKIFSSHMTGNIITFAYDVLHFKQKNDWSKLIAVPVFMAGGIFAGFVSQYKKKKSMLLGINAFLFLIISLISILSDYITILASLNVFYPFILVFIMGIQGSFSKLQISSSVGSTVAMTGNMTTMSLDFDQLLFGKFNFSKELAGQFLLITGFLLGGLSGGFLANCYGFNTVIFPGLITCFLYFTYKD